MRQSCAVPPGRLRSYVRIFGQAPNLHPKALVTLKRMMEVVADGAGTLTILRAGHPMLRYSLRYPTMEQIGSHAASFLLEGIGDGPQASIDWLLGGCTANGRSVAAMIDAPPIDLLVDRLRTLPEIEHHLTLAFEHGFRSGVKPVTAERLDERGNAVVEG